MNARLKRLRRAKNSTMVFEYSGSSGEPGIGIMFFFTVHDRITYTY
jgi:hypothetical protein